MKPLRIFISPTEKSYMAFKPAVCFLYCWLRWNRWNPVNCRSL